MYGPWENHIYEQPAIYTCGDSEQNWTLYTNCAGQQYNHLRERLGNLNHANFGSTCTRVTTQWHRNATAAETDSDLGDDKCAGGAKNETMAGEKRADTGHPRGHAHGTTRYTHA